MPYFVVIVNVLLCILENINLHMNINLHVSSLYLIILLLLAILEKYAIRIKGYAIRMPLSATSLQITTKTRQHLGGFIDGLHKGLQT